MVSSCLPLLVTVQSGRILSEVDRAQTRMAHELPPLFNFYNFMFGDNGDALYF